MSEITLVKTRDFTLTQVQRDVLAEVLFGGCIDGMAPDDKRAWRRFWKSIFNLGLGEFFSIETWAPRIGGFHRMHMKMESVVFQAQERIATFEQFRLWIKIGAGFVDWMAGPKGGVVPVPRSISYKKCDEDTMRKFHDDSVAFLRGEHAPRYLWPHLDAHAAGEMMETVLGRFR